jgi:hypothetical protein
MSTQEHNDDLRHIATHHEKDQEKSAYSTELLKPLVEKTEILHDRFLVLAKDTLILPPSYTRRYDYYKLETNGLRAVSVVARVKDSNKYVILKEYRQVISQILSN